LFDAYLEARKGKRKKTDEHMFELNATEHLIRLTDEILERRYHPSPGIAFITFRPVTREIFAAPFRDRVVHHFLYNACADWWDRRFIADSYSCREHKGTLYGINRAAKHIRAVSDNYTKPAYVIKLDIQGYFMSLPRQKLYERVSWGLKQQFASEPRIYDICDYLWRKVIFDDPTKGVRKRGWPENWRDLPKSKSLFCQPPGQGIVIGNLTSQLMSNIYLDRLDRFVKYELGYNHYGRYVDDFYLIVSEAEYAQAKLDVEKIRDFLKTELNLTLHPHKYYYQEIWKGMDFIGARLYPYVKLPSKRFRRNFHEAARECMAGERSPESITAYLGLLKHLNGRKIEKEVFGSVGWDYES